MGCSDNEEVRSYAFYTRPIRNGVRAVSEHMSLQIGAVTHSRAENAPSYTMTSPALNTISKLSFHLATLIPSYTTLIQHDPCAFLSGSHMKGTKAS